MKRLSGCILGEVKQVSRCVLVLVVAIIACVALVPAQVASVTLTHLANSAHHDAHRTFVEDKAIEFSRLHPDVEIEVLASAGAYVESIIVAAAGGVSYDIIEPTSAQISDLVSQNLLLDLHPFMKRSGLTLSEFIPIALLPFQWDNKLLGLPSEIVAVTTISNVRLFEQAGLQTPQQLGAAWNWDALLEMAPRLSRDIAGTGVRDRWAVAMVATFHRVLPAFVHNAGGDAFDKQVQPRNAMFTKDPAVAEGLQFFLDLYWRDWLTTDAGTFRSAQTTAMNMTDGSWWIGLAEELHDPFEYEVAPYPAGPRRQGSEAQANGFCVGAQTKDPEKAFEWVRFLTADPDNAVTYMRATGRPTAYLRSSPRFPTLFSSRHPASILAWIEVLTHPDVRTRAVTPAYASISNEFNARFKEVMSQRRSLQDILEHMQRYAQSRLDEVWEK
jgi:ABC-type glycerol-3-phosphate transport system substrate-binding protein